MIKVTFLRTLHFPTNTYNNNKVPAVLEVDVCEETLVVLGGVVKGWRGDERMLLWPGVLKRQHPRISCHHPLLLADLDVRNHWNAVIFTCDEFQ